MKKKINSDLRKIIVDVVTKSGWGHIPSSFSILEILKVLYFKFLKINPKNPEDINRDYFILSKGHGCVALYTVLNRKGLLSNKDLSNFSKVDAILGEHPDATKIKFVEASCGSLGHGLSFAIGIAYSLKLQKKRNRVVVLVGDGECQEGTVWEAAHIARNKKLDNLILIVDYNKSGEQLLPIDNLNKKWKSFGWKTFVSDGHNESELLHNLKKADKYKNLPKVIIAKTIKGKGVSFIEGHGPWHHKIPNKEEYNKIIQELSDE